MDPTPQDNTDASSTKPVSSLRSHFEQIANSNTTGGAATPISRGSSPRILPQAGGANHPVSGSPQRASLDLSRRNASWNNTNPSSSHENLRVPGDSAFRSTTPDHGPRQRPVSMGPWSPPRSPPLLVLDPPASSSRPSHMRVPSSSEFRTPVNGSSRELSFKIELAGSSPTRHSRGLSRSTTPRLEPHRSGAPGMVTSREVSRSPTRPPKSGLVKGPSMPPPVNRAGKPKIPQKPATMSLNTNNTKLAPSSIPVEQDKTSPFSTPPSGDESPDLDNGSPPSLSTSNDRSVSGGRNHNFQPPPIHYSVAERRKQQDAASPVMSRQSSEPFVRGIQRKIQGPGDLPENRPGLPPRHVSQQENPTHPSKRSVSREVPGRASLDGPSPTTTLVANSARFPPPPKRSNASGAFEAPQKQSTATTGADKSTSRVDPRSSPVVPIAGTVAPVGVALESVSRSDSKPLNLVDFPDASQANRRPPRFKHRPYEIETQYDTRLLSTWGEYVCTTGHLTRVWSTRTGESLMTLTPDEMIRITAVSFTGTLPVGGGDPRLWLGTNSGELQEIDVLSQTLIASNASAHARRDIIKVYRQPSEMWSLDDEGKLQVWPAASGTQTSSLTKSPQTFRVPRGHNFSIAIGGKLWMAFGKEIKIFQPSSNSDVQFQVLNKGLSQSAAGDVTAAAIIPSQKDRIYFGHSDGKVTVYSVTDYTCLGVVNVSLYKISCMTGAGGYLWAAYNTGKIYVYDTTSEPWRVVKDWQAHTEPVLSMVTDATSLWRQDRLQVVSLGADKAISIWDGLLQEDWLESEMQEHDVEFCKFREVSALVVTWNAGASKPSNLKYAEGDQEAFRNIFRERELPHIIVFGFQELVNLEDKKMTAKSLLMGSKRKDSSEQEHMSRQYRDWRDYLTRCLEDCMPIDEPYYPLHSASLVGLFTCIFVRGSEKSHVRRIDAAEVKRGLGGLHGNKGALIVRLLFDDSSLCFINCHLAAGQTQSVQRNNDLTAILETSALPAERDSDTRASLFVGGGDGTMILDHEICILNGDLNYRIDTMGRDTVINAVKARNYSKLLERDQLLLSRKRNPMSRLRAFMEAPLEFPPTYKYDVGTNNYDSSEKRRAPAWCDRLLFRGIGRIKQLDYRRHEVRTSDHRPVSGLFKILVKNVQPEKRAAVREKSERKFEETRQRIFSETKYVKRGHL